MIANNKTPSFFYRHFQPIRFRILLSLILALLGNIFFFRQVGSVFVVTVFIILWLYITLLYLDRKKWKLAGLNFGFLVLISINILKNSNSFVVFLTALSGLGLIGIYAYILLFKRSSLERFLEFIVFPFKLLGKWLEGAGEALATILSVKKLSNVFGESVISTRWAQIRSIIVGFLISIPLIWVILSLLTTADPIYSKIVGGYLTKAHLAELFQRVSLTLFLLFMALPWAMTQVKAASLRAKISLNALRREITIIVLTIIAVMVSYIGVSWQYVFARVVRETELSQFGVLTYSEYVKKGFSELLVVSAILYGLMWLSRLALSGSSVKHKPLVLATVLLTIVYFIFAALILRRVGLYINFHGLSLVRIYGVWFLIYLLVMFTMVLFRNFIKYKFSGLELYFSIIWVLVLGWFNFESIIVRINPPTVNNRIDYVYLSRFSSDGIEGWNQSYEFARDTLLGVHNKQGVIGMIERRDIAYSGNITKRLFQNYTDLMFKYGSVSEIREYLQNILVAKAQSYHDAEISVRREIDRMRRQNPSDLENSIKLLEERARTHRRAIKDLGDINTRIKADDNLYKYKDLINYYPNLPDVGLGESYFTSLDKLEPINFYNVRFDNKSPEGNLTRLDRLFIWNASEYNAHLTFTGQGKVKEIFELQKLFSDLYRRIQDQDIEDRGYSSDISLRSPFVD